MSIDLTKKYIPSQAERLKFAPIALSALQALGYPTTSDYGAMDGRYAVLTYVLNPTTVNLTGATITVNVSDIDVANWNELINETYSGTALSANVCVTCPVSTIIVEPNTLWIGSTSIGATAIAVWSAINPPLREIEIQNRTEDSIFVIPSSTSYDGATSVGIEIFADTYYSASRSITNLTIASVSGGDVRILGYL